MIGREKEIIPVFVYGDGKLLKKLSAVYFDSEKKGGDDGGK